MTNILTLRLDAGSQAHFDGLRERYFPPERNYIAAHLTMFHALPDRTDVEAVCATAAARRPTFPVEVTGVRSLGKGVAYRLASPSLMGLHAELATAFAAELPAQDRQKFMPHIVVQNKVTPAEAKALLGQLTASFVPTAVMAEGLDLWHYLGGPWEHARTFPFAGG